MFSWRNQFRIKRIIFITKLIELNFKINYWIVFKINMFNVFNLLFLWNQLQHSKIPVLMKSNLKSILLPLNLELQSIKTKINNKFKTIIRNFYMNFTSFSNDLFISSEWLFKLTVSISDSSSFLLKSSFSLFCCSIF